MNNVPKYNKDSSWRVFEKRLFSLFDSIGKYLRPKVQMDALISSQPEDEEVMNGWIEMSLSCIFLAPSNTWLVLAITTKTLARD